MSKQFCQHLTGRVMPRNTTQREVSKSRMRWGSLRPWKRLTSCWPLLPDFTQLSVRVCSPTDIHVNYFHPRWSGCCDVGLTCGSVQNMGSADNGSDYGVPYSRWPWIKGLLCVWEWVSLYENTSCSKRMKSMRRRGDRGGGHGQAGQAHEGFVFAETSAQCEAYMQLKPHKQAQWVRGQDSDLVLLTELRQQQEREVNHQMTL